MEDWLPYFFTILHCVWEALKTIGCDQIILNAFVVEVTTPKDSKEGYLNAMI